MTPGLLAALSAMLIGYWWGYRRGLEHGAAAVKEAK